MANEKKQKSLWRSITSPAGLLVIAMIVLLIMFFVRSKETSRTNVDNLMYGQAKELADDLRRNIDSLTDMAIPVGAYLNDVEEFDEQIVAKMCSILGNTTGAYKALIVAGDGTGIWSDGETFDQENSPFFYQVFEIESKHLFRAVLDDRNTIATCVPFNRGEQVWEIVQFYDLSEFKRIVKSSNSDSSAFVALIDTTGNFVLRNGSNSNFLKQDNILDSWSGSKDKNVATFRTRLKSKSEANITLTLDGEDRVLYVAPVNISDMMVVIGSTKHYVDVKVKIVDKKSTAILRIFLVVVVLFVLTMASQIIVANLKSAKNEHALETKADTDLLTGLNNKLATERKIKEYMQDNPDGTGMMILLDLDNFKKINDTKGHAFGDEVLRTLGSQLSPLFRVSDIVGRIGGDEFMIFLKGISDKDTVLKQSKKLVQFFRTFQAGDYVKYSATASIGVAIYPQDGATFETLYKATDKALYKSKKNGKNQVAFCDDSYDEDAVRINS